MNQKGNNPNVKVKLILSMVFNYFKWGWIILNKRKVHKYWKYQKMRPHGVKPLICYAPFKNMYFGHRGVVVACCANRFSQLGNVTDQTIKQIWEGKNYLELKEKIKNYDFPVGCNQCLDRIKKGSYQTVNALLFDGHKQRHDYPVMISFELSNACNLQCVMCSSVFSSSFRDSDKEHTSDPYYSEDFLKQLEEFLPYLKEVTFLGGEPFLIGIYFKIWERLIEVNPTCVIHVQTNATILNEKIKALLEKGNFKLNVSIDSFQKEVYESIRVNSKYEIMVDNFNYFKDLSARRNQSLTVMVCPMRQNWNEIPEIVSYCNKSNVNIFFNTVTKPVTHSIYYLPISEQETILDYMLAAQISENTNLEKENKEQYDCLIQQLKGWIIQRKEQKEKIKSNLKKYQSKNERINQMSVEQVVNDLFRIIEQKFAKEDINNFHENFKKVILRFEKHILIKHAISRILDIADDEFLKVFYQSNEVELSLKITNIIQVCEHEQHVLNEVVLEKSTIKDN